eukprot:2071016-Prymnesium_polylepis.1
MGEGRLVRSDLRVARAPRVTDQQQINHQKSRDTPIRDLWVRVGVTAVERFMGGAVPFASRVARARRRVARAQCGLAGRRALRPPLVSRLRRPTSDAPVRVPRRTGNRDRMERPHGVN